MRGHCGLSAPASCLARVRAPRPHRPTSGPSRFGEIAYGGTARLIPSSPAPRETFPPQPTHTGYAFAGYKISTDEQLRGYRFGTTTSLLHTGVMGYRYYTTKRAMPALPLAALGLVGAAYHGAKYIEWSET